MSENVRLVVNTVDNDLISIGALNTDDSEAIEFMVSHGVTKVNHRRSPLNERSAEHDVAGMTVKIEATFENSGVIS